MALEVINDSGSEPHRNWVSSAVTQVLGFRVDYGFWVLRLSRLEVDLLSVALSGPPGPVLTVEIPRPGPERMGELKRALNSATLTIR